MLSFIQGPPAKTFPIGPKFFPFFPLFFFPVRQAVFEADLPFPESGGIGHTGAIAAIFTVGHGRELENVDYFQGCLAGVVGDDLIPAGINIIDLLFNRRRKRVNKLI